MKCLKICFCAIPLASRTGARLQSELKLLDENMQELSLVLQLIGYGHVTCNDVKMHEFKAPKASMKEIKLAHRQYAQHLENLKVTKKSYFKQKKTIHTQIIEIKSQTEYVMSCI